jgi:hypothetical protein
MPCNLVRTMLSIAVLGVCLSLAPTTACAQQQAAQNETMAPNNAGSQGTPKPSSLSQRTAKEQKMSLEELEKRIRALEDVDQIRKLHQHYIDLMDNLRYEEVLDLFTDDATVEVRDSGIKRGRQELGEIYLGLAKRRGSVRFDAHMAVEPDIVVEGTSAKGTWLIYMLFSKPSIQWVQGKNECEYRKAGGRWKIAKLKFTRTLASDPAMYP